MTKRTTTLIAAGAALGLAAFASAGAPPEETATTAPPATDQPAATTPPADSAAPASEPAAPQGASSTPDATAASSSDATSADPQSVPAAPAPTSAAAPVSSDNMRLAAITPSGMSPQEACTGFQSTEECATALHVAQNLNIPLADLKAKVAAGTKMDAAIKELKPDANATSELRKAQMQVRADAQADRG